VVVAEAARALAVEAAGEGATTIVAMRASRANRAGSLSRRRRGSRCIGSAEPAIVI